MNEVLICSKTLPEAYHKSLCALHGLGHISDCIDWNTEQLELSITIVIIEPLTEPMISKLFIGGPHELEQYRQEMLDGILDFEISKGNWEYTYHDRMTHFPTWNGAVNQVAFVIDELKRNPSSRRAVINVREVNRDVKSSDPACLQHIQYFIRDNKLDCKVLFRSNDACKAAFMNMFALIMLQKRIADELGVEVGTYTHRANSFHCYKKDFNMLENYIEAINSDQNLTYNYEDDWKILMEEEQPSIKEKVEKLKSAR